MKLFLVLIFYCTVGYSAISEPKVTALRQLFYKSESDKSSWLKMQEMLKSVDSKSSAVLICYKGVSEMMGAKYTVSPITKLRRFKKGRTLIENAIKKDTEDPEVRFLRFSIQTNLPAFLGYDDEIEEDKSKLIYSVGNIKDKQLKNNIISYLSSSKHLTEPEKKRLKK